MNRSDSTTAIALINVTKKTIGDEEINSVDARELHEFLEVGKDFSNWIKDRINRYDFVQNQDFIVFAGNGVKPSGGRSRIEYALTIDMAKELSMVERNEKGKQARQYFIECEKKTRQQLQLTPSEQLLQSVQLTVDLEKKQKRLEVGHIEHDRRLEMIEAQMKEDPGYFAITGYAKLVGTFVDMDLAKRLGKEASKLSRDLGVTISKVKHTQFGLINAYHESILEKVFSQCKEVIHA